MKKEYFVAVVLCGMAVVALVASAILMHQNKPVKTAVAQLCCITFIILAIIKFRNILQ